MKKLQKHNKAALPLLEAAIRSEVWCFLKSNKFYCLVDQGKDAEHCISIPRSLGYILCPILQINTLQVRANKCVSFQMDGFRFHIGRHCPMSSTAVFSDGPISNLTTNLRRLLRASLVLSPAKRTSALTPQLFSYQNYKPFHSSTVFYLTIISLMYQCNIK